MVDIDRATVWPGCTLSDIMRLTWIGQGLAETHSANDTMWLT